ncbi:MAG TPA: hypothetical protein VK208_00585 [Pyrinomonadaceae bacterium]|nr:hypothetical protein [Pyrinomonadaceae bacterium]
MRQGRRQTADGRQQAGTRSKRPSADLSTTVPLSNIAAYDYYT